MGAYVTNYSKHGDINRYIANYAKNKRKFELYRKNWENVTETNPNLLFLLIESTPLCNLVCPMCIHSIEYDKFPAMDDQLFELVLNAIKEMEIPSVNMNQTNEPFLDKKIIERIQKVNELDCVVDISMNTNAVMLNKERSEKILYSGLTRLLIGFDAFSEEVFEKVRKSASYKDVFNNIIHFIELKEGKNLKLPIIRLSFVRNSVNEHEIEQWYGFWKDKVDLLSIQEYLSPTMDDSRNFLSPKASLRKNIPKSEISCRQPAERIGVRANGDVVPCCAHFANKMPIGNLFKNSLRDIWNGNKMKNLQNIFSNKAWEKHPICNKCLKISYEIED